MGTREKTKNPCPRPPAPFKKEKIGPFMSAS